MERTILHCDLNNFFASVECLKFPELKGYPVAVSGNVENRHGIILAKNEIAKKFGVKTAEVVWEAQRKCPELVLLPPHMDEYIYYSHKVREIYKEYTDLVEPFGIDECWLDVTGSRLLFGDGEEIANTIRKRIKNELNLTISVGVSFNKIYAKLGSDIKKPDAVTVISRENYKQKVYPLNANEMIGIGKKTYNQLCKYGIKTIGDLAGASPNLMTRLFGKVGPELIRNAAGEEDSPVKHQDYSDEAKSIGNSHTCSHDLTTAEEVWKRMYTLSENVGDSLREQRLLACGVQVTVKNNALVTKEFQAPLPVPTRNPRIIADFSQNLFLKNYNFQYPVRLLGVRTYNLISDKESMQCSLLFDDKENEKQEHLEEQIFELRKKYGKELISRGSLLKNEKDE